jgi:hypothetical protein
MCRIIEWPGYDTDELFRHQRLINEPDFLALHFIRILIQAEKVFADASWKAGVMTQKRSPGWWHQGSKVRTIGKTGGH